MRLSKWLLSVVFFLASSMALAGTLDINSADAEALASGINGVGIKRAEAIVAYRDEHGPFKSVSELTQVKGIGLKIVEANRENLVAMQPKKVQVKKVQPKK